MIKPNQKCIKHSFRKQNTQKDKILIKTQKEFQPKMIETKKENAKKEKPSSANQKLIPETSMP